MMKTAFLSIILITMLLLTSCQHSTEQREWDVSQGYVPDSTTAVQIAQILFVRVYGEKVLEKKPFVATLKNGNIWVVEGSIDKGVDGGVPHLEIQKSDGKIVYLIHGK